MIEAGRHGHHWLIPQGGWGTHIGDWLKNQPWNIMEMTAAEHNALHACSRAGDILNVVKNGSPLWFKFGAGSAAGHAADTGGTAFSGGWPNPLMNPLWGGGTP